MKRLRRHAECVSLLLLTTSTLLADVVTTSDGSRLVGTIEHIAGGKVVIQTEIAGRLEIDASKVVAIATDRSVNVAVESGDMLVGRIVLTPDEKGSIVQSRLGEISILASGIEQLWSEGAESPEILAIRAEAQEVIEAAKPKWTVTLEGGVVRKEGNTDTLEGHGNFEIKRTTSDDLLQLYLRGRYGENNGERTDNEYLGGIRYENQMTQRWFWYARTELEFDEFEQLDLRTTAAAGVGYYWLKKQKHELKTSLGMGYRHESYNTGRTLDDSVLDLGLDYRVDLAPWGQFTHSTVYSPDFLEFANYRLRIDTALLIPFQNNNLAWKLGMRNEYNSRPVSGNDRLDNTYYTSIVLSLK